MANRFALVRLVAVLALGAMVSFMAMGCGDDNNPAQKDAGQHDVNIQQDDGPPQQDVAAKTDGQKDGALQDDAAPQADAANTGGVVTIVQVAPQPTGTAFDAVKLARIAASWDAIIPPGDNPTAKIDQRNAAGIGCYAKYYRFTNGIDYDSGTPIYNMNDAGPTIPVDDTANAGDITVTGYTGGSYIVGFDTDAGAPVTMPMNATSTCKRSEILTGNDAGTGRYEYNCDVLAAPVTGFLVPGTDKLTVNAAGGGLEIGAFSATNVEVAPFIEITAAGVLWGITNPALHTDGGVTLPYRCGVADGGTDKACSAVLGLLIQWTDAVTPADELMPRSPINEMGKIQCSSMTPGSSYTIPPEVWAVAFPAGNGAKSVLSYVTHMSMTVKHGMTTLVGVGGGQIGLTHQ